MPANELSSLDGRRRTIANAEASPDLAGLGLVDLRQYRQQLHSEEDRIGYWRRLVQRRIEVLDTDARADAPLGLDALAKVLGETADGSSREVLDEVHPDDPLPELPDLAEAWGDAVDPDDKGEVSRCVARLRRAEAQLDDYRSVLHARLREATAELIVRYQLDPTKALSAFPRRRTR